MGISFSTVLGHAQERYHPHHSSAFQEWLWLLKLQPCFFPFVAQPKGLDVDVAHVGACGAQEHMPAAQLGSLPANLLQMRIEKCVVPRWERSAGGAALLKGRSIWGWVSAYFIMCFYYLILQEAL